MSISKIEERLKLSVGMQTKNFLLLEIIFSWVTPYTWYTDFVILCGVNILLSVYSFLVGLSFKD